MAEPLAVGQRELEPELIQDDFLSFEPTFRRSLAAFPGIFRGRRAATPARRSAGPGPGGE